MGWADLLFELGIPYHSDEAIQLADRIWSFVERAGHQESQALAEERGPFPNWERSIYGDGPPLRNSTVTTIAPTGTISIIADASSGIEPIFALAFQHKVEDRTLTFVNPFFVEAAKRRGIHSEELMSRVSAAGTVHGVDGVPEDMQRVFVTAHEVAPEWHVKMQAAFQRHTDNGTSKTINLPNQATREDVAQAYDLAWDLGCLGITVFRDGCKGAQVLNVGVDNKKAETVRETPEDRATQAPLPGLAAIKPRPRKVSGETHKIRTPVGTAYVTVNMDEDGDPLEAFVNIGNSGSDIMAVAEALGRLISLVLRTPSPLTQQEKITQVVDQLSGIGGSRSLGFGAQRVLSLPDALAQVLSEYTEQVEKHIERTGTLPDFSVKADLCPSCGWAAFTHEEGCKKCHFCGFSEC
jgi:ribonucleoside-diphosphate reductase alpha chain